MKFAFFSGVMCVLVASMSLTTAQATVIAQWSFPDQGLGANADLSASNVVSGASAGAVILGTGATNPYTLLVQDVSGTDYTYIDSSGSAPTQPGGADASTSSPYAYVADWNDGTPGNGTVLPAGISGGQTPEPSGSGPAAAGALFLSSPGQDKLNLSAAKSNNFGITFSVTASSAPIEISGFSFYASRGSSGPRRSWEEWYLEVDTGSGFSLLDSDTSGSIPTNSTWGLETATFSTFTLGIGDTATFQLIGVSDENSQFGRGVALDDLTLTGSVIPEPASLVLIGFGSILIASRRRPSDSRRA